MNILKKIDLFGAFEKMLKNHESAKKLNMSAQK